jgi:hypothetical protein
VNETASSVELVLEKAISFLRERAWKTAICRWDITPMKKLLPRCIFPAPLLYFPNENANVEDFLSSAPSPQGLMYQIG